MDILLRHLVYFLLQAVVNVVQVFQILYFVGHAARKQRFLVFYLSHKLVIVYLVEWVPGHLLGSICENAFKLIFIVLVDVLAFFQLARDFKQLLDQLLLTQLQLADSDLSANF